MTCLTEAALMAELMEDDATENGVAATYYPQVLTGYDEATGERDPSEATAVSVTLLMSSDTETAPDGVLARSATFILPYSSSLGFTPHANDRFTAGGYSWRVSECVTERGGGAVASYALTVESEGAV